MFILLYLFVLFLLIKFNVIFYINLIVIYRYFNMSKTVRKAAGFVVYRKNCNEIIEYLLMQASYANFHWTPPKGIINIVIIIPVNCFNES